MRRDNLNYLLVGLFTLAMLAALLVALFRITGRDVDARDYYAVFDHVGGVREGTSVTYNGFHIGQVAGIDALREDGRTRYRLGLAIRADWRIPADSSARIVAPGLLSERIIDIREGSSTQMLSPGETLAGTDATDLMATLAEVALEIRELSRAGLRPLLADLGRQVNLLAADVGSRIASVSDDITRLLANLERTATELNRIVGAASERQVANVLANAEQVAANLAEVSAGFVTTRGELDRLLGESNQLVEENRADLRAAVSSLRESLETIGLSLDSVLHNLETTSRNMSEFSREIRHNPGRLLSGQAPPDRALE